MLQPKKIQLLCLRNLASETSTVLIENDASKIKPFEAIPTAPGGQTPILGHIPTLFRTKYGFGKSWMNFKDLKAKYAKNDNIMRFRVPLYNRRNGNLVVLFESNEIETIYRAEGKYPFRGAGFEAFHFIKKRRSDIFSETTGVLTEEGQKWHEVRSKVQQDLMRPKSALFYVDGLQEVAQDFVIFIREKRDLGNGGTMNDFLPDIYKFTLEAITLVALDSRVGCLEPEMDPEIAKVFSATKVLFENFAPLLIDFPWWKYVPPRWHRRYRETEDGFEVLLNFGQKKVAEAIAKMEKKRDDLGGEVSVLEKLIIRNGEDSGIPIVMALDMMLAGIDTTGNTLGFLLYNLAVNPEKQEKLREECLRSGERLTPQTLDKMRYYKACARESLRLTPTIPAFVRNIVDDVVIQGYNIPKDTMVLWHPAIMSQQEEHFPDWNVFRPERWLSESKENKICPYASRQFSKGPRMCIGKRFAELELLLVTHRLISNFDIKWTGRTPLTLSRGLINVPDYPLNFQFVDLKNKQW